jgi:hypothetical protein
LTGYLGRAGFGVRVAFCAVATVLLVLAFRGSGGPVNQARAAPPWPAPASVPVGVRAAGLAPPASPGDVVRFAVPVTVYLNGSRVTGPPGSVMLTPHQEIAVTWRPGRIAVADGCAFPAGT